MPAVSSAPADWDVADLPARAFLKRKGTRPGGGGPVSSFFPQPRDPPPPTDFFLTRRFHQWSVVDVGRVCQPAALFSSQQPF